MVPLTPTSPATAAPGTGGVGPTDRVSERYRFTTALTPSVVSRRRGRGGRFRLFVVRHEILPGTHGHGNEEVATSGLMLGFAAMIILDAAVA